MAYVVEQKASNFKKMGEGMVDVVTNRIIKDAMTPLLDALDKVIAKAVTALEKVTGIGVPSLPAGSVPGATPPTLPSAGGIPGIPTGTIGSIPTLPGPVTDIGAIGTGAIGDTVATGDTLAGIGQSAADAATSASEAAGSAASAASSVADSVEPLTTIGQSASDAASAASDAASSTASAAGSVADSASSISSASGAIGASIAPLAGIVTGAISAVTGVIGVFQNMHQETSLNAIELNTRQTAILLGTQHADKTGFQDADNIKTWTKFGAVTTGEIKDALYSTIHPDLVGIWVDAGQIVQAIVNLPSTLKDIFTVSGNVHLDGQELFQSFVTYLVNSGQKIPQS